MDTAGKFLYDNYVQALRNITSITEQLQDAMQVLKIDNISCFEDGSLRNKHTLTALSMSPRVMYSRWSTWRHFGNWNLQSKSSSALLLSLADAYPGTNSPRSHPSGLWLIYHISRDLGRCKHPLPWNKLFQGPRNTAHTAKGCARHWGETGHCGTLAYHLDRMARSWGHGEHALISEGFRPPWGPCGHMVVELTKAH